MIDAFSSVSEKLGLLAAAHCKKRATAEYGTLSLTLSDSFEPGKVSGKTGYSYSPCRRKAVLLVTRIFTVGQVLKSSPSKGAASTNCSKLSSSSSKRRP